MQVDRAQQRAITRLCIQCGLFLLQHGAESALVEELSTRLGLALGMDSVESAISSNAIVLTTIKDGECLTSTRKNVDRGINMHVVTEVQHIVILAEHKLLDYRDVEKRFAQIRPLRYPRWLLVIMVGLSCALSQFAGYYCYRGEPVVRLAGEAPFRYAGHAQVVNGEQAAAQLIIFRDRKAHV